MSTRLRRAQTDSGPSRLWSGLYRDQRQQDDYFLSNGGIRANVTLQMLIVMNAIYSLAWGSVWIALYSYKYRHWKADLLASFLNPMLFAIWAVIEPLRFWFGITGNLKDKVANMAAFFLLTLFPQMFAHVFLLAAPSFLLPFEGISGAVMIVILATEAVVSYGATRKLIRKSTTSFHLQEDVDGVAPER